MSGDVVELEEQLGLVAVASLTGAGGEGACFRAVALAYVLDFAMVNGEIIKYIDQIIKKSDEMTINDVRTLFMGAGPTIVGAALGR